jgi:hypothetical protein
MAWARSRACASTISRGRGPPTPPPTRSSRATRGGRLPGRALRRTPGTSRPGGHRLSPAAWWRPIRSAGLVPGRWPSCTSGSATEDKLWCVAATLTFLRKAGRRAEGDLRGEAGPSLALPEKLPAPLWQRIAHPEEDPLVGPLFTLAGPFVALAAPRAHTVFGLRRGDRVDAPPATIARCRGRWRAPPGPWGCRCRICSTTSRIARRWCCATCARGRAHAGAGGGCTRGQDRPARAGVPRGAGGGAAAARGAFCAGWARPRFLASALETVLGLGGALPVPMDPLSEAVAAALPPEVGRAAGRGGAQAGGGARAQASVTAWMAGVDLTGRAHRLRPDRRPGRRGAR